MTKTDNENIWKGYRKNKLNYYCLRPLPSSHLLDGARGEGWEESNKQKKERKEGGEAGRKRKVQWTGMASPAKRDLGQRGSKYTTLLAGTSTYCSLPGKGWEACHLAGWNIAPKTLTRVIRGQDIRAIPGGHDYVRSRKGTAAQAGEVATPVVFVGLGSQLIVKGGKWKVNKINFQGWHI